MGQAAWFSLIVLVSVWVVAAAVGRQAASDYLLGLVQTWFIVALFGLISLAVHFVVACVAWVLRAASVWIRIAVVGSLGILGSLYLSATLPRSDGASGVEIGGIVGGVVAGFAFGLFAAVVAGHGSRSSS